MKEEVFHLLALTLVPGLGTSRLHQLIRRYDSPREAFQRSPGELVRHFSLPQQSRAFIANGGVLRAAEATLKETRAERIQVLSYFDDQYPQLLKEIFEPPLILYCLGKVETLSHPSIALVGSRRCSVYGKEVSRKLARDLASAGVGIVSGLARGIDSQAHLGALEAQGLTITVLGSGVDVVYPRENRRLYGRIREQGCIISEFPCGTFPAPQNFPIRNRIISGLCYGTLITEASEFSGSLITARLSLEQNREVLAVPGNITSPGSYGPNYLIKQGAKPVLCAQDVLEELPHYVLEFLTPKKGGGKEEPAECRKPEQEKLLKLLAADASVHLDQLLEISKLGQAELNRALLELEMEGLIRRLPGCRFSRILL